MPSAAGRPELQPYFEALLDEPLDMAGVARRHLRLLVEHGLGDHGAVAMVDGESDRLDALAVVSVDDDLRHWMHRWFDEHSFRRYRHPLNQLLSTGTTRRFTAATNDQLAAQMRAAYRPLVARMGTRSLMLSAVRAHSEIIGVLALSRDQPYSPGDAHLVEQVNATAGVMLSNARLLRRHQCYLAVVEAMAGQLTLPAVYDAVLPALRRVLEVDVVRIMRLSADGSHLYSGVTIGSAGAIGGVGGTDRVSVGEGFTGRVAADQQPLVLEHADRSLLAAPDTCGRLGSLAGVPVADHELLGVLVVGTVGHRRFSSDDLELLQLTADRLAMATRQDQTDQALERSAAFSRSVLENVVDAVITVDERGTITSVNPATLAMFGYESDDLVGHPVAVLMPEPDRSHHERHVSRYLETGEPRILGTVREVWARRRDGSVFPVELGVSEVNTTGRQRFFTGVIHDVTARRRAQDELRHQALHDPLTGLPNRALFGDHLGEALARSSRSGAPVGLLLVDLDEFKAANDRHGHPAGDELLRQAAQRLRAVLRPFDTVARLGGDEFGVVVQDARRDEDVVRVARRVHERFGVPFVVDGQHVRCTASIGVAQTAGGREAADELLRHADAALYQAKERGRNRFELFDEPLRSRLQLRVRREGELLRAIDRHEVEPWFQPILDLRDNRIAAVEVLARWRHPERGLLAGCELIPLAEDTGLIVALGGDVADQAVAARDAWAAAGGRAPDLTINLSEQELAVPGDVPTVERLGVPAGHLWVELSEAALSRPGKGPGSVLAGLRARGGRVVVDHFGTGSSNIGRLGRGTADALKIDRRFVAGFGTDPEATTVVEGAIALGRALDLDVVAVGVEHIEQLERLRDLGCTHAQGFAIAAAVPAEEIPDLVRTWR
jgi:diguanylate cyclase (GGDEF)-like protein/PAS domain S-box-containing protein